MATDTNLNTIIINKLTKAQYELAQKNANEFYVVTDAESVAYITETYSNGTEWYRVYSDGWCEQGGVKLNITPNTFVFVTLLKPFANTNYSVIGSGINAEIGTYADEAFSYHPPLQTTGFYGGIRYWTDGNAYPTRGFSWRAEGYISQE